MRHARGVRRFGFVAAAAAAALLGVEACSDAVSEGLVDAGTMLVDAGADGGLVDDAGRLLIDAGTSIQGGRSDVAAQIAAAFNSGSRIKMRVTLQKGADGSQYGGYPTPFDTMLNVDCSPGTAADGKTRCLPKSLTTVYGYFADSACTQPLALETNPCAPLPPFASQPVAASSCQAQASTRIFSVGAAHTAPLFTKSGTSCVATTSPEGWRHYRLGAEVPATSLVEFTESEPGVL